MHTTKAIKNISLLKSDVIVIEEGIIESKIKESVMLEVEDIMEIKKANLSLTQGKKYAVLVTSGYLSGISKEARVLTASKEFVMNTVAKAFFVESVGHRIVGNFYLNINKPYIKTKIFSNREKAIDWLREQLKKFTQA